MIARDTLVYNTLASMARQRPGLDEVRCQAVLELLATADSVRGVLRRNVASLGISELQFSVLVVLFSLAPQSCTPALLADHTCVSRSAITDALDRLEARQWIERERSKVDRRTYAIHLTEPGRILIDRLAPDVLRLMGDLAGVLGGEKPRTLIQLCEGLCGAKAQLLS